MKRIIYQPSRGWDSPGHVPILAYHKIDAIKELGITCILPGTFEKQMRFLAQNGYQSISPEHLVASITGSRGEAKVKSEAKPTLFASPLPEKPILLTFDDGYENFYTHAYPILKRYGYTALIFMLTGYIDNWNLWEVKLSKDRFKHLSRTQIQELSEEGFWFGSHGVNHLFLTYQSDSLAKKEVQLSRAILEEILGKPTQFFSYPYGDYDARIVRFVQEAGYQAAFGLHPARAIKIDNLYSLPRCVIYLSDTLWEFKAKLKLMGNICFQLECAKNILINKFAYANLLRKRITITNYEEKC